MPDTDYMSAFRDMSPEDFCAHYLLEGRPFAFKSDVQWVTWKSTLADELDVDSKSLVLVGSGSIGFSLNPFNNLREFLPTSDMDVAVVSEWHFDVAWRFLSRVGPERYKWSRKAQDSFRDHKSRLVFNRTIATDQLVQYLPFGKQWVEGLEHASTRDPASGRRVNARVYRDFQSLREYQVRGVREAKSRMESK